ncbi:uncharacterized protein TNCV_1748221 [Trichonephila clavipes]|nr:uncharacterized protein TNCV_1748221 [Trichonephila clavipes]
MIFFYDFKKFRNVFNSHNWSCIHIITSSSATSRPAGRVVSVTDCGAVGIGIESRRRHGFYKCIVPSRHGGTLNSRRAACPLVRLVEGEERWEALGHPQGFLPPNWGGTEQNRTVTCMVPKAKANDRCKNVSP